MPICTVSGAYIVQPTPGAPPGTKNEMTSRLAANGRIQNDQLFIRANAMSGAPIIIGICQFAKPTNAGMIAPNTMISPCIVVNWLNRSGLKNWMPGSNSSSRIAIAITPPTMNMMKLNHRYSVPMSLWFVVMIQRMTPPSVAMPVIVVPCGGVSVVVDYCAHRCLLAATCGRL
jgi:hypothetical protein